MSAEHPEGPIEDVAYHVVQGVATLVVTGMTDQDDRLRTTVGLHLWVLDLPESPEPHGKFAMLPENAELLADALRQAAADARRQGG